MSDQIVLDLGEHGEFVVESFGPLPERPTEPEAGLVEAGLGETLHETGQRIRVNAQKLLKLPLTGLAKLLQASLPDVASSDQWQLDEFVVEFEMGLEADIGSNLGAVVVITPNGSFKCTYTWKRKEDKAISKSDKPTGSRLL